MGRSVASLFDTHVLVGRVVPQGEVLNLQGVENQNAALFLSSLLVLVSLLIITDIQAVYKQYTSTGRLQDGRQRDKDKHSECYTNSTVCERVYVSQLTQLQQCTHQPLLFFFG